MKTYRAAIPLIVATVLTLTGCGHNNMAEGKVAPKEGLPPTTVKIPAPNEDATVMLHIVLPEGWEVNADFGTLVYEPANRSDFFDIPSIEIVTAVEGQATPEAIPENVARYIQQTKDGCTKISTGNPDLDAQGANVEIIEETQGPGEWRLTLTLTYPEGVSEAMYPPRYWIYRFLHRADEPFFVLIKGKVPIKEADTLLTPVSDACRSAVRLSSVP